MAKYLETVYVSGWQSSSTASSSNEPGPDLAGTSSVSLGNFVQSPRNLAILTMRHLYRLPLEHCA